MKTLLLLLAAGAAQASQTTPYTMEVIGATPELRLQTSSTRTVLKLSHEDYPASAPNEFYMGLESFGDPLIYMSAMQPSVRINEYTLGVPSLYYSKMKINGDVNVEGTLTLDREREPGVVMYDSAGVKRGELQVLTTQGQQFLRVRHNYQGAGSSGKILLDSRGSFVGIGGQAGATYAVTITGSTLVDGSFRVNSSSTQKASGGTDKWSVYSDERLKKDIQPYALGLKELQAVRPVTFQYNGQGPSHADGRTWTGIVAQELEKVVPEMVSTDAQSGYRQLDGGAFTYLAINAVKQLAEENKALKARLATLEARARK